MTGLSIRISYACIFIVSMSCLLGCATSSIPVRFTALNPPDLKIAVGQTIANMGFNGDNLSLNDQVSFHLTRRLRADSTITVVEPREMMRILSRFDYTAGAISDSLALIAGRSAGADLVLIGDLQKTYTEQYGEEKKYRMEEAFTPSGLRLIDIPYYEAFIDQAAVLSATLRTFQTATGDLVNEQHVRVSDTLRVVLPTLIDQPPVGRISVENITPQLLRGVRDELITSLVAAFAWHQVIVTREIYEKIRPDNADIAALRGGDWEGARRLWEQAVEDQPDDAAAWNNLAVAYEQAGMLQEAEQAYTRALTLRPKDKTIKRNSGGVRQ